MSETKKLSERKWAIRIGTFSDSIPFFLVAGLDGPRLFATRKKAHEYKREHCLLYDRRAWAIVRVAVTEL